MNSISALGLTDLIQPLYERIKGRPMDTRVATTLAKVIGKLQQHTLAKPAANKTGTLLRLSDWEDTIRFRASSYRLNKFHSYLCKCNAKKLAFLIFIFFVLITSNDFNGILQLRAMFVFICLYSACFQHLSAEKFFMTKPGKIWPRNSEVTATRSPHFQSLKSVNDNYTDLSLCCIRNGVKYTIVIHLPTCNTWVVSAF